MVTAEFEVAGHQQPEGCIHSWLRSLLRRDTQLGGGPRGVIRWPKVRHHVEQTYQPGGQGVMPVLRLA